MLIGCTEDHAVRHEQSNTRSRQADGGQQTSPEMDCKAMDRVAWIRDGRLVGRISLGRDLVDSTRPGLGSVIKHRTANRESPTIGQRRPEELFPRAPPGSLWSNASCENRSKCPSLPKILIAHRSSGRSRGRNQPSQPPIYIDQGKLFFEESNIFRIATFRMEVDISRRDLGLDWSPRDSTYSRACSNL